MKLPDWNYRRGLLRLWAAVAVPWVLFVGIAVVDDALAERERLQRSGWCLSFDPTEFTWDHDGKPMATNQTTEIHLPGTDGSVTTFVPNSWGWCRLDTSAISLRRASLEDALWFGGMPFLLLIGSLILHRVAVWVAAGFKHV